MRGTPLFSVLLADAQVYDEWARRIAAGEWFGTQVFYQAPLYPYTLAVAYRLLGADPWHARCAQALLGSLSCVLLAVAGRRFYSPGVGLGAGAALALYAPLVYFDGLIQKPVLDVLFTCLVLALLGEGARGARRWPAPAAGAALGLLALSRENALVLAPVALAWVLLGNPDAARAGRLGRALAFATGLALVLVPVGLRNRAIGGEFLVTTAQLGPNLYIGNHHQAGGSYGALVPGRANPSFERADAVALAQAAAGRALSPGEVSDYWAGRAFDFVREHPGEWLQLLAKKWAMVWNAREYVDTESLEAYAEWSGVLRTLAPALHFGVLGPLAVAGVWLTRRRWRELWLLYAFALAFAASVAAFYVLARYRVPLVPVLALFAAAGLAELAASGRAARVGFAVCALAGAVAMNWPQPVLWNPRAITYQNVGIELLKAGRERGRRGDPDGASHLYGQSEGMFSRVLALAPPRTPPAAEARRMLGLAYELGGKRDLAIEQYRQALALVPQDAEVQEFLGDLLAQKGLTAEAYGHWQAAARLAPGDEGLRRKLAESRSTGQVPGPAPPTPAR